MEKIQAAVKSSVKITVGRAPALAAKAPQKNLPVAPPANTKDNARPIVPMEAAFACSRKTNYKKST